VVRASGQQAKPWRNRVGEQKPAGKPFEIPKQEVWDAWLKVKANGGAPGADGQGFVKVGVTVCDLRGLAEAGPRGCLRVFAAACASLYVITVRAYGAVVMRWIWRKRGRGRASAGDDSGSHTS
jgi:hypothetical protein